MVVGIKFKEDGKVYNFLSELELTQGQKVIVETERGMQLGMVSALDVKNVSNKNLKEVTKPATESDYEKYLNNLSEARKVLETARKLVKDLKLNMNVIDATFSLDKKLLLLNFVSDERIDFRELVKDLAAKYHTRIELHQIGVRDKAKEIGGVGLCGRVLCCAGHLKNINSVNINMVKNQDIALNPTKINGACGRLLCCFNYENDLYEECRSLLPKVKQKVKYKNKDVEVTKLNILQKSYTVKIDENTFEEVSIDDKM